MTYKYTKFEDSAVYRSLERVALQKGLIKPKTIQKTAAPAFDPEKSSFSENLLVLCDMLRSRGFSKQANELEVKFLLLKKAELHLYDTHGEKGEDVINFAHPDGSNKLDKSWSDLGTVETILDKHEKILDVVQKQPKGKLAGANIVNALKVALAQAPDALQQTINDNMDIIRERFMAVHKEIRDEGSLSSLGRLPGYTLLARDLMNNVNARPVTLDAVENINADLFHITNLIKPGPTGGVSQQAWDVVGPILDSGFKSYLVNIKAAVAQQNKMKAQEMTGQTIPEVSIEGKPEAARPLPAYASLYEKLDADFAKLKEWKGTVSTYPNPKDVEKGMGYINGFVKALYDVSEDMAKVPAAEAPAHVQDFSGRIAEAEKQMAEFESKWVS